MTGRDNCAKQVGFTATQVRLVYEKHSQMTKLERRVKRIKSHSKNRVSFTAASVSSPLLLEEKNCGAGVGMEEEGGSTVAVAS